MWLDFVDSPLVCINRKNYISNLNYFKSAAKTFFLFFTFHRPLSHFTPFLKIWILDSKPYMISSVAHLPYISYWAKSFTSRRKLVATKSLIEVHSNRKAYLQCPKDTVTQPISQNVWQLCRISGKWNSIWTKDETTRAWEIKFQTIITSN